MKKWTKSKRITISFAVIISIFIGVFNPINISKANNNQCNFTPDDIYTDYSKVKRDTAISVDSNGVLQISRTTHDNEKIMGKENSWTIFMYITGSNLESQYHYASSDIKEILKANFNTQNIENLNIIIQTGGSKDWHKEYISNNTIQRYKVDANKDELTLIEEFDNTSMGNADTLYNFLSWGVKNYASEHMGVIFWNHGSGVDNGLCNDENFENDSLSVHELEYTFAKLSKRMTSKFEVIGFDTCLSGSIEYANLLAPYAKYMIASADIEPGQGWRYTEPINFLLDNPDATGDQLGRIICDTYAGYIENMSSGWARKIDYTLATYDLSKVDKACIETNYLTKYLYDKLLSKEAEYWTLSNLRSTRLRYNIDNIDIGSILEYLDSFDNYDYNTTYYRQAMKDLIIYSRISDKYLKRQALGISIYWPSSVINLSQLNSYRNVCFSPYWLKYLEWVNIRALSKTMEHFQYYHWEKSPFFFEENFNFMNYDSLNSSGYDVNSVAYTTLIKNHDYRESSFPRKWYCNVLNVKRKPGSSIILDPESIKTKSNKKSFKLDIDSINHINNIYTNIYTETKEGLLCLGQNNKTHIEQSTGMVTSNFDSKWFMLPDGQLLTTYILSKEDNITIYSLPIMIDNIESSIRIEETITPDGLSTINMLGVWDTTGNANKKDSFQRGYLPLTEGTTIEPIYDIYNDQTKTFDSEYGDPYTIPKDFNVLLGTLPKDNYLYSYEVKHLDETSTHTKLFTLTN